MHQLKQSSSDQVRSIEERVGCRARPSGRTDTRSKIQNLLQMGGELSTCIFTPVYQPDCSSDLVSLVVCVMLTADRSLSGSGVELHEHNGEGGKRGDRTRVSGGAESSETLNRIQTRKSDEVCACRLASMLLMNSKLVNWLLEQNRHEWSGDQTDVIYARRNFALLMKNLSGVTQAGRFTGEVAFLNICSHYVQSHLFVFLPHSLTLFFRSYDNWMIKRNLNVVGNIWDNVSIELIYNKGLVAFRSFTSIHDVILL